jgi:membrane associated rhomboid family serine protease
MGHARYLVFYLVCGVLASLAHIVATLIFHGDTIIPSLGASGAISGVLGAYILLFPNRRVTVLLVRILTEVPAWVAIGMWFVFHLISGLGTLGGAMHGGGVAYAAHIGGFLAGAVLIRPFLIGLPAPHPVSPPRRRWGYR